MVIPLKTTASKAVAAKTSLTIGVDLGGTKIEAVLHDGKTIIKSARVPTQAEKPYATVLGNVVKAIEQVRTPEVVAIGIGTPGYVHDGILKGAPNNKSLEGKPLARDLEKKLKLPVIHENDAKCFAFAEATVGAGAGKQNVLGVIIGTGVGCGIVMDGKILRGTLGAAGEVGHNPYRTHDYEYYSAGPSIERMYKEAGGKEKLKSEEILKWKDTKVSPTEKDAITNTQDQTYDTIAHLCASLVNTFNPDMIVCGGGVSKSLDFARVTREAKKYALPTPFSVVTIKRFAVSDSAGAIGAAMLARQHAISTKKK